MPPILIADAGPIVAFIASNQWELLLDVVKRTHAQPMLIPHQVDQEIARVLRNKKGAAALGRYVWVKKQSNQVRILPEISVGTGDPTVFTVAAGLLDTLPNSITERTRDAGEAFAVAHAAVMRKSGLSVDVYLDDSGGRSMAAKYQVPCVDTYLVLQYAIDFGLIVSKPELRRIYEALAKHLHMLSIYASGLLRQVH